MFCTMKTYSCTDQYKKENNPNLVSHGFQSPSIQLIDAGLGVIHAGQEGQFLR